MTMRAKEQKPFSCERCGECCKQPGFVYVKTGEAEKIAKFLNLDIYRFTQKFCDLQDRSKLVLKKNQDESCPFLHSSRHSLSQEGGDMNGLHGNPAPKGAVSMTVTIDGCMIYDVKPKQCSDFHIEWQTERSAHYCAGLR